MHFGDFAMTLFMDLEDYMDFGRMDLGLCVNFGW